MSIEALAAPVELPDLDSASAESILAYAIGRFSPHIAVASSMQDAVVVDLAVRHDPGIEVFFLDTGFHFPETLETARRLEARYGLNLVVLRPEPNAAVYDADGIDACCAARKVAPIERYLATKLAWVTGLRRDETPARAGARALEWDAARGLVKVNPLVSWTDADVARYAHDHDLTVNPLRDLGYASIGCAPCTRPGAGREGRWAGTEKQECGLHQRLQPQPVTVGRQ